MTAIKIKANFEFFFKKVRAKQKKHAKTDNSKILALVWKMTDRELRQQKRAKGIAKNKKEKKNKIEISLWINKTRYDYGILCTFCAKLPAICHCPECPDFYCSSCDINAHATKKRKDHIRSFIEIFEISKYVYIIVQVEIIQVKPKHGR